MSLAPYHVLMVLGSHDVSILKINILKLYISTKSDEIAS